MFTSGTFGAEHCCEQTLFSAGVVTLKCYVYIKNKKSLKFESNLEKKLSDKVALLHAMSEVTKTYTLLYIIIYYNLKYDTGRQPETKCPQQCLSRAKEHRNH